MRIFLFFFLSLLTSTVFAFSDNPFIEGCNAPDDLRDYEVWNGNYSLNRGSDFKSSGLYVDGNVNISGNATFTGNIYATGNISVSYFSTVTGSIYAEGSSSVSWTSNVTGENCRGVVPLSTYCDNPPDIRDYTLHGGNLNIPRNSSRPESGRENLYVTGSVNLGVNSRYYGNIYAVGDVYLNNNAVIDGDVYSQDGIVYRNRNSDITGETCENGDPIAIPLDLPVDELTPICSDIFKDATQSYSNSGKLTMWGESKINDDNYHTIIFDFSTHEQWGNQNGCGTNVQCTSTGKQSAKLSDFDISEISGLNQVNVTPDDWGDGGNIILGDPLSSNANFRGSVFGAVTIYAGGTLTFAPQAEGHVYRINRLNIYAGGIVKLNAGTYALNGLGLTDNSSIIEVLADADIYLFANKVDSIQGKIINDGTGRLVLATKESISMNGNAQFNGDIYANGTLQLNNNVVINGRTASEHLTMNTNAIINNNRVCDITPDDDYQFVINTTTDALTCEPHSVTIQVLLDGNIVSDYSGSINLATSSNIGTWSILNGDGSLTDSGNNNGQASYQFASDGSDAGQIELGLFHEQADTLTVTINSSEGVTTISDSIIFRPFLLEGELPDVMTANLPVKLTLTAVGEDQTKEGSCRIIEEYTGDQNLKFWSTYKNPVFPEGSISVEVNDVKIKQTASAAENQIVLFADGVATVFINYPDAGKIQIYARDDKGIGAPPDEENDELQGSFLTVVKPASLFIGKITDNHGDDELGYDPKTGSKFKRASVPDYSDIQVDTFKLTVKAIIDCTDDPLKHCSTDLDDPTVTPSFISQITLKTSLIFPVSTSDAVATLGTLHVDPDKTLTQKMTKGELIYSDLAYDEVGIVGITATSEDYLGVAITRSDIKHVGRFYPDYFSYEGYRYDAGCADSTYMMAEGSTTPLAESAVAISYILRAQAQVSVGAILKITENYDAGLEYPIVTTDDFNDFVYAQDGSDLSTRLFPATYYDKENWSKGQYKVDVLEIGLQKSSQPDGPYFNNVINKQLEYFLQLTGFDDEKLQIDGQTSCSDDKCLLQDTANTSSFGDFAYGRLHASNAHGSEFQALRTKVEATYFDGVNFVPFADDNCTVIMKEQTDMIKNPVALNTDLTVINEHNAFVNGFGYFEFSAPKTRGKLDYVIQLKNNSDSDLDISWLLDSGNAVSCGGAEDCIKGYVEFGLFRGNDRIIYRRQSFE